MLFMSLMGEYRGIMKMIKFFEDATVGSLKSEYNKTKEALLKNHELQKSRNDWAEGYMLNKY